MRQVDDSDVAGVGERRPQIVRLGGLAPVKAHVNELGAEGLHHAGPALAEIAGGEDELAGRRARPAKTCLRTNPDRLPLQAVPALDEATSARAAVDEDAVHPRVDARYAEREPLLPEVGELARHATEQDEGLSRRASRCRLADRRDVVTREAFWSKRGGNDVDGKASAVAPAAEGAAHADVFCRETQADVSARGWNQRE